jgi:hypothetical protein
MFKKKIACQFGNGKYDISMWTTDGSQFDRYWYMDGFSVVNNSKETQYQQISNNSSLLLINQILEPTTRWIMVRVQKDGKETDTYIQPENGGWMKKAYMKFGAGTYHVEVWQTDGRKMEIINYATSFKL